MWRALICAAFVVLALCGCQARDFVILVPTDGDVLVEEEGGSKNQQVVLDDRVIWRWTRANAQGVSYQIHTGPSMPNVILSVDDGTISVGAGTSPTLSCIDLVAGRIECWISHPAEREDVKLCYLLTREDSETSDCSNLELRTVGRQIIVDGILRRTRTRAEN